MHPSGSNDDSASSLEIEAQRFQIDHLSADATELLGPPCRLEDASAHWVLPLSLLG